MRPARGRSQPDRGRWAQIGNGELSTIGSGEKHPQYAGDPDLRLVQQPAGSATTVAASPNWSRTAAGSTARKLPATTAASPDSDQPTVTTAARRRRRAAPARTLPRIRHSGQRSAENHCDAPARAS